MNGLQQGTEDFSQLNPQGIFGSILGGAAGRLIGGLIGGKKGQNIGGIAGKIGGGFLPFSVAPGVAQPNAANAWLARIGFIGDADRFRDLLVVCDPSPAWV